MFLLHKSSRTLTQFPHRFTGLKYGTTQWREPLCIRVDTRRVRLTGAPQVWPHGGAAKGQTLPNVNGAQRTSGGTAERPVTGVALTEVLFLFSLQVCCVGLIQVVITRGPSFSSF